MQKQKVVIFSILLTFLMLVSVFVCNFPKQEIYKVNAASNLGETLDGSGTYNDPYLITNTSDYQLFVNEMNTSDSEYNNSDTYFAIASPSSINFNSITKSTINKFYANLDGRFCKLTNLKFNLINVNYGIVSNINIDGVTLSTDDLHKSYWSFVSQSYWDISEE
ncbi:MAG: hypothetical protein IJX26_00450, partial [Clostridia bacterium]|nr:hypothetical protein [Clostridia bacterium]